ncbi:hypothetical protein ABZ401_22235 [Streptomyces sp. NPDC005892]|uniref:DUF6924 domain-containing protein n=1 Tax=Streptomyces sp. NPDC005892 TaxID=3155593 RepID=UPI0033CF2DFF
MRILPALELTGRDPADDFDPVIVRTDYTDDVAWRATVAALRSAWDGESGAEARFHLIDDPRWDGATTEELVRAAGAVENLSAVFLADAVTMRSSSRPLLALDLCADEDEELDHEYYQELIDNPPAREFRTVPGQVHALQLCLAVGNVSFPELAEAAAEDPEGVYRPA